MQKIVYYLLLIVLPLVIFSCKDDEDPSTSSDDLPGALVANIDGQSFDFRYQPRAYNGTSQIGDDIYDAIFINGTTRIDFTNELNIDIVNPVVGTFDLDSASLSRIYYSQIFENGTGDSYGSTAGTLTVTELGARIKGTFNATLINFDSIEISMEGSFDLGISD